MAEMVQETTVTATNGQLALTTLLPAHSVCLLSLTPGL